MEKENNTKDALGQEIVMDNLYGYSQSKNGHNDIRVGRAKHFNRGGSVSLELVMKSTALWFYEAKSESMEHSNKVISVKPSMVFPVSEEWLDRYEAEKAKAVVTT